jgi:peptidoglycan hydrolase-like protein with peptidoglycan-binding domain
LRKTAWIQILPVLFLVAFLCAETTDTETTDSTTTTAKKKSAPKKSSSKKKTSTRKPVASWRNTQRAPTPERYKEIQQALATKGYFTGTPSGVWDPSSVDALKRFQEDQNLEPSGKLDSLSLIALGLGPKHDKAPAPQP